MNDQEKKKEIEKIASQYQSEMVFLQREKDELLAEFSNELEKIKIEELKSKLQ